MNVASIVARANRTADDRRHLSKRRCQPSSLCGSRYRAAPHGSIGSDSPWAAAAALRSLSATPMIGCVCPLFGTAETGVRSQWLTTGRLRAINNVPASSSAVNTPFALYCSRTPPCPLPHAVCLAPSIHRCLSTAAYALHAASAWRHPSHSKCHSTHPWSLH